VEEMGLAGGALGLKWFMSLVGVGIPHVLCVDNRFLTLGSPVEYIEVWYHVLKFYILCFHMFIFF
jgi:hypothetical protein